MKNMILRGIDKQFASAAVLLCVLQVPPALSAEPKLVVLDVQVTLDQVSARGGEDGHTKVGQIDRLRITYNPAAVDPSTHRVPLINFQHLVDGQYRPAVPDPVDMPMNDAWLDLGVHPYRMHFRAAVVHGSPILIDVDEVTRRLAIHPQNDPLAVSISGPYEIDPTPVLAGSASNKP